MNNEGQTLEQHMDAAVIETDPMSKMNCANCGAVIDIEGLPRFSSIACPVCGKENSVPAKLGHFVLLKSLGSGGMGTVFLAEDENLGRKVAIKVMQRQLGQDPALFETFRNEAQSAARLNHPHVAQIYSFGREKGLPYLAMELVNGNKLDGMIDSGTVLDPAFVLRVGLEIAEGLKAAEEVGLFHGDIKPDNILFDENMQAKLVDFGIASMASQGASSELWGTPYYIAPEKVQKKKNSARSDIYSLGATLYHAIAGQPPYEGPDAVAVIKARFAGPPPSLESIRPDIEPEVSRIIGRMMYNDLFMRYPNYGSLINDIKAYLANIPESRKAGPGKRQTIRNTAATMQTGSISIEPSTPTASKKSGKKFVITKGAMASSSPSTISTPALANNLSVVPTQSTSSQIQIDTPNPGQKKFNSGKFILFSILIGVIIIIGIIVGTFLFIKSNNDDREEMHNTLLTDIERINSFVESSSKKIESKIEEIKKYKDDSAELLKEVEKVYNDAAGISPIFPDFEPETIQTSDNEVSEDTTSASTEEQTESSDEETASAMSNPLKGKTIETITAKLIADNPELAKLVGEKLLTKMEKQKARTSYLDTMNEEPTEEQILKRAINTIGKNLPTRLAELDEADKEAISAAIKAASGEIEATIEEANAAAAEAAEAAEEEEEVVAVNDSNAKVRATLDSSAEKNIYIHIKAIHQALYNAQYAYNETEFYIEEYDPSAPSARLRVVLDNRKEIEQQFKNIEKDVNSQLATAEKAYYAAKGKGINQLQRDARGFIAQRKRLEREAQQAKEAAEADARRIAEEARQQAFIREEIDRINSVLANKKDYIDKFEYDRVISDMKRMEAELSKDEAKEELNFVIKRFERLIELRDFMLNDLDKNIGLRRGYRRHDISGISKDRTIIYVKPNKEIPVSSLTYSDWQTLLINLIIRREGNRTISFSDKANQLFNAAIFCYVHDSGNTIADQIMRDCATKAIKQQKSLSTDARRLIPSLTQEEIDAVLKDDSEDLFSSDGY